MGTFLFQSLVGAWEVLLEASPYVLLGLLVTGLLHVLLPVRYLLRLLGGRGPWPALKAALFALPLPICSCGIMPLIVSLKRKGVPRSALMTLLVATPETGVSALLLTFALLGPVLGWLRPALALLAALGGALVIHWVDGRRREAGEEVSEEGGEEPGEASLKGRRTWQERLMGGVRRLIRHAFVEILDDVAGWILIGALLSGVLSALLPQGVLAEKGPVPILLAMAMSLPLYMCSTGSTPLGYALALKGLGPGAVLAFLVLGPITNVGSLALVHKHLGPAFLKVYLGVMVVVVALAATAVDALYPGFSAHLATSSQSASALPTWLSVAAAVLFLGLSVMSLIRSGLARRLGERVAHRRPRWGRRLVLWLATLGVLLLLSLSFSVVDPERRGFRLRFGAVVEELGPGFHLKWPFEAVRSEPEGKIFMVTVGFSFLDKEEAMVQVSSVPDGWLGGQLRYAHEEALTFTGDELLVELPFVVHYRVKESRQYFLSLQDGPGLVKELAKEEVRALARQSSFARILQQGRTALAAEARAKLQEAMDRLAMGVEVVHLLVVDLHPPSQAAWAYREVSNAREDFASLKERARGRGLWSLAQAKGQAATLRGKAQQYYDERLAEARGFTAAFRSRLEEYNREPQMTRHRLFLEMLEKTLPRVEKMVVPASSSRDGLDLWLSWPGKALPSPPRQQRSRAPAPPESAQDRDTPQAGDPIEIER